MNTFYAYGKFLCTFLLVITALVKLSHRIKDTEISTFSHQQPPQNLIAGTNMQSTVNPYRSSAPRLPMAPRAGTPENPRRIRMCIMLPTKSIPVDETESHSSLNSSALRKQIENAPLLTVALASILDTSDESDNLEYLLLVAYNHDDFLFGSLEGRKFAGEAAVAAMGVRSNVHMLFRPVYMTSGTTVLWNTLAGWGYDIGCDYFVPANDDLLWRSPGWALSAIAELRGREDPCPNFGIVGLSDETFPDFPTFHVISRLHVYIHSRAYYPVKLLGFGVDPWIFYSYDSVYASYFSKDIVVINRVLGYNRTTKMITNNMSPFFQRYERGIELLNKLKELVDEEKNFLLDWTNKATNVCCDSIECSEPLTGSSLSVSKFATFSLRKA